MPHADLEQRKEYQRNYQREYMRKKRAEKRAAMGPRQVKMCGCPGSTVTRWKCPVCIKAYQAEWRKNNAAHMKAQQKEYRERNAEKRKASNARWRAANKEYIKERYAAWQKANPLAVATHANNRRARLLSAPTVPFTATQLAAKWAYWGDRCWMCGDPASQTDHVKPISKGGAHMLANLRPICKSCNCRKSDRWPL